MKMEIGTHNIHSSTRKGLQTQVISSQNYYLPLDTAMNREAGAGGSI